MAEIAAKDRKEREKMGEDMMGGVRQSKERRKKGTITQLAQHAVGILVKCIE